MKRLVIIGLFVNAILLGTRVWQEVQATAQEGRNEAQRPDFETSNWCGDVNGDHAFDLSDPIALLNRLFLGGEPLWCEEPENSLPEELEFRRRVAGNWLVLLDGASDGCGNPFRTSLTLNAGGTSIRVEGDGPSVIQGQWERTGPRTIRLTEYVDRRSIGRPEEIALVHGSLTFNESITRFNWCTTWKRINAPDGTLPNTDQPTDEFWSAGHGVRMAFRDPTDLVGECPLGFDCFTPPSGD